jgi:hypothetical protein
MQEAQMNINTKCNGCVFSVYENNIQISCKLDRHNKLTYDTHDEQGAFILNRFCSTYRPQNWLEELSVQESENIVSTVLREIIPCVGFFVFLKTDSFDAMSQLESTIKDIKNQSFAARYVVVSTDKVEYNEGIQELLCKYFDFDTTNHHIVQLIQQPSSMPFIIDECFKHAKNGWAYVCESGESIENKLIEKIHKRVNLDLKRLSVIKPYKEPLNGLLFQTALFKFLHGNTVKLFKDDVVDNREFLDKVANAAIKSDPDTFITWEQFNES